MATRPKPSAPGKAGTAAALKAEDMRNPATKFLAIFILLEKTAVTPSSDDGQFGHFDLPLQVKRGRQDELPRVDDAIGRCGPVRKSTRCQQAAAIFLNVLHVELEIRPD